MMRLTCLLVLGLLGCAGSGLSSGTAADLRVKGLAAAVHVSPRTITYFEASSAGFGMFGGFPVAARKQQATLDGTWNPDAELSASFSNDLVAQKMRARPITQLLDHENLEAFWTAADAVLPDDAGALKLEQSIADRLARAGISYLILLRCYGFNVQTTTSAWDLATGRIPADLLVFDVANNREVHRESADPHGDYKHPNKDPRVIERNQAMMLRTLSKTWISKFVVNKGRRTLRLDR